MEVNRHQRGGLLAREDACHWYHRLPLSALDMLGYLTVFGLLIYFLSLSLGTQPASDPAVALPEQRAAEVVRIGDSNDERLQDDVSSRTQPSTRHVADLQSGLPDMARVFEELKAKLQRPQWALLDSDIVDMQRTLNQLVGQGSAALPAIRHYLNSSSDAEGAVLKALGYPTLRLALFDVVAKIGGSQAEDIFYRELQLTPNPLEIATLGRYLEAASPGLYRQDILEAARNTFVLARGDGIGGRDTGPLFQVFNDYGDASLAAELEQVSQLRWGQYAAITLANLPDGSGISSLASWVDGQPRRNVSARFALQMLAQAADDPEAQRVLINGVRNDQLPDSLWPAFAQAIAGIYQIQLTNPNTQGFEGMARLNAGEPSVLSVGKMVSMTPGGGQEVFGVSYSAPVLLPEQALQRLALLDTLIETSSNPTAKRELEKAYEILLSFVVRDQGSY